MRNQVTPRWARDVLQAGASCFRVNTAHEDAVEWLRAISVIREQAAALGRDVRLRGTRAPAGGFRIRAGMGVNLPDTPTAAVAAMSDKDRDSLVFATPKGRTRRTVPMTTTLYNAL